MNRRTAMSFGLASAGVLAVPRGIVIAQEERRITNSFYARIQCNGRWVTLGGAKTAQLQNVEENNYSSVFHITQEPYGDGRRAYTWIRSITVNRFLRVVDEHLQELKADVHAKSAPDREDATFTMKAVPADDPDSETPYHLLTTSIRCGIQPERSYVWAEEDVDTERYHLRANRDNDDNPFAEFRIYDCRD
jgi:hypothetical protein